MQLRILGINSATPAHGRHPSAQVLWVHNEPILIDCGEGTQMQLSKFKVKYMGIRFILISHLHSDHFLGILGLLSTMSLFNRKKPLIICAPKGIDVFIGSFLSVSETELSYSIEYRFLEPGNQSVISEPFLRITSFSLNHRIPCFGFLFEEIPKKRKLNMSLVLKYGLVGSEIHKLINGQDYITLDDETIKNECFFLEEISSKKFAYVSDTTVVKENEILLKGVDLLYHETTFGHELAERAEKTHHSTTIQAAHFALNCEAKQLIIGHFSARYKNLDVLLNESKSIFENTLLAIEGQDYFC